MKPQIDIGLYISYAVTLAMMITFMVLYSKERTKYITEFLKNVSLDKELNEVKSQKSTGPKKAAFIEALSELAHAGLTLMQSFRDGNDFLLDLSQDMLSQSVSIDNNTKMAVIVDIVHGRGEIARFMKSTFDVTQNHPELTSRVKEEKETADFHSAKKAVLAMVDIAELSDKFCTRIIGYITAAEDRNMMVSDARLAVTMAELAKYLIEEIELQSNPSPEKKELVDSLTKKLNKMQSLTNAINNYVSKSPEESNDLDFEPMRENDSDSEPHSSPVSRFHNEHVEKMGGRVVAAHQTKEGKGDFETMLRVMEQAKKVSKYIKAEDIPAQNKYTRDMFEAGRKYSSDPSDFNYEDFRHKAVDLIPAITTISNYGLWYKFFYETRTKNRKENASMDHPSHAIRVIYMADVKLEAIMEDFEKNASEEDKEAIQEIKEAIGHIEKL